MNDLLGIACGFLRFGSCFPHPLSAVLWGKQTRIKLSALFALLCRHLCQFSGIEVVLRDLEIPKESKANQPLSSSELAAWEGAGVLNSKQTYFLLSHSDRVLTGFFLLLYF